MRLDTLERRAEAVSRSQVPQDGPRYRRHPSRAVRRQGLSGRPPGDRHSALRPDRSPGRRLRRRSLRSGATRTPFRTTPRGASSSKSRAAISIPTWSTPFCRPKTSSWPLRQKYSEAQLARRPPGRRASKAVAAGIRDVGAASQACSRIPRASSAVPGRSSDFLSPQSKSLPNRSLNAAEHCRLGCW